MRRLRALALLVSGACLVSACSAGRSAAPASKGQLVPIVAEAVRMTVGSPLVDPAQITSGGPGVDGIPAIDRPVHVPAAEAARSLVDTEQVLLVSLGGQALAFPLRSLIAHEIANDRLAGVPVAATWCPLCNTGAVYERTVADAVTTFGVTGTLYNSAMVMYDRASRSLWTQPDGRAVAGRATGKRLTVVPSELLSWAEARRTFPRLMVALGSRAELDAATNPYEGYDTSNAPFLFHGRLDPRLPPFERVVGVSFGGRSRAWPFSLLRGARAVNDVVGGQRLVVLWAPGTSSPLDSGDVTRGRDIGSAGVYAPTVRGRALTFQPAPNGFRDRETASTWTLGGLAVAGPLRGQRLTVLPSQDAFWFAWAAFNPQTELVGAPRR